VHWIVIENPYLKSDLGFGLTIQIQKIFFNKLLVYDAKFKTIPSYNQKLKVMEDD
jgi:hypothetical protein